MDLNCLKAFCTVVEAGSISKASKKLFVSQPSLSLKMQDLETYYQALLLERTNKGIHPTEAGVVVYQHAQKMLSIGDCIERDLVRIGEGYLMQYGTFVGLVLGSLLGAWNLNWWLTATVRISPTVFLPHVMGWPTALLLHIFLLVLLGFLLQGLLSGYP